MPATVDNRANGVIELKLVGEDKRLTGEHLIASLGVAPGANEYIVEHDSGLRRNANQPAGSGFCQAFHRERDIFYNPRLHRHHTRNVFYLRRQAFGGTLHLHKYVGKAVLAIIGFLSELERMVGAHHCHQASDSAGDDQHNRQHLTPHV